nr:YtcA family lipoprotein [uncultured Rhodopila sp.]
MGGAPTFSIAGAYFPAWMVCLCLGIASSLLGRVVFIAIGIDRLLPLKFAVYVSLGLLAGLAIWLWFFQQ